MKKKSSKSSKGISVYANLVARRKSKADARSRKRAEYLATLPKNPLKRFFYRLHPKRVMKFWFSREGAILALKLAGVGVVIIGIFVAALFAYYRRELDIIRPGELAKNVQSTVTKYVDRNGELLWEDRGDGDYKQVVDSQDVAQVMKDATVAIEDKDFFKHSGVSFTGILRATLNNFFGGGNTQGASTLTQQLIKNVYFADDAAANRLNVSRKIKEIILAIEVERMYNKDQILTLYLNEVPYGGRRNGVESAALSYFGKHAKDVNIAEAALLASIPQNPTYYNPYALDPDSSKDLIGRQQYVIDQMAEQGYVTQDQATEAKAYPILDNIKPEITATENIKAPHAVLTARSVLESEFGQRAMREGGMTVKLTIDYRIQKIAEEAVANNTKNIKANGADNVAVSSIDVPTGQVLAMVGSLGFDIPGFGQTNAAAAPSKLDPGSSIKPFIYANLLKQREGQNFGAGSMLTDVNIDSIYCKGSPGKCTLGNFDGRFLGPLSVRDSLGNSRNPPAVQAMYITGPDSAIETVHDAGDKVYCDGVPYSLSAAIGGGCGVHQVEHTNAYATLARQGVYKPVSYVLEVTNAQGVVIKQWKDEGQRVLDPQIPFILSDILTDQNARSRVFAASTPGMNIAGVKTATKTGTTDDGNNHAKDSWMMSYSPRMATGVWVGKHDGKAVNFASNQGTGGVIRDLMGRAHKEIFANDGSWKEGDWFPQPSGIQRVAVNGKTDLYPSWYTKPAHAEGQKVMFDTISKKKATACTPERAKSEQVVQTFEDPVTKNKTLSAPGGFNPNEDDDVHKCDDAKPTVTIATPTQVGGPTSKTYRITATVGQGTHALATLEISVDGELISNQPVNSPGSYSVDHTFTSSGSKTITARVTDAVLYDGSATKPLNVVASNHGDDGPTLPWRRNRG